MSDILEKPNRGGGYFALLLIFVVALFLLWVGSYVFFQINRSGVYASFHMSRATIGPAQGVFYDNRVFVDRHLFYIHRPLEVMRKAMFPSWGADCLLKDWGE